MGKRSNSLLVILVSLFLLPWLPLCAQGAAMEMNGDVAVAGTLSATSFFGSGAGLTNIPGTAISGTSITANQIADGAVTPVKIGFLGKVAIVAVSGGDYTNPATAMGDCVSWCGAPSENNTCLLKIMPGVYDVGTSPVVMQPYIDIEGSGESVTVITGSVATLSAPTNGVVNGASNAEIRFLTVRNTGPGAYVAALLNNGASPRMTHITATASGGTFSYGVWNHSSSPAMNNVTAGASGGTRSDGVCNYSSSTVMNNVAATASGGAINSAVENIVSSPVMNNVTATASGGTSDIGVENNNSSAVMNNVVATGSGGTNSNKGVSNASSSPVLIDVIATASGGTSSYGIYNVNMSSPIITNVTATATGGTNNYGLYNSATTGAHTIKIDRSTFSGSTNSIRNDTEFTLWIGATNLTGGDVNVAGTYHCIGVYDGDDYTTLNASCQ